MRKEATSLSAEVEEVEDRTLICIALFRENSPLKRTEWHVLKRDHSFTCHTHTHVYPQME